MYYIKAKNIFKSDPNHEMYIAWQDPGWEDTGYYYSSAKSIEEFIDIVRKNHNSYHPFIFKTEDEARAFMKKEFEDLTEDEYIICKLEEES